MKKLFILPLALLISFFSTANNPDEGMWIPLHLKNMNEADMKKLGLELGADDLYNVAKSSLKDAIVRLNNGGCTAEIVSGEGLVFTNHHCAYGAIWDAIDKSLINKESYKKNGFWSMSQNEEIGGLQLNAGILMSIEKVTNKVYPELEKTDSEEARSAKLRELAAELEKEAEGDNQFIDAQLKEMFAGNEYYLYTYKVYQDVRLVGSPPESIGKFGGDTDNWMWPRHTGDFAILRIYADDKNEPAEYSENNKPYTPKHFLPVSIEDKKPGDFSMIMGYPGTTERYLTSYDLETKLNYTLPARVETRAVVLDVMGKYMAQDDKLDTRLKSKRARIANYWKLWSGQMQMARLYDLTSEQEKEDQELKAWIEDDNRRINRFGSVLAGIENHNKMVQEVDPYTASYTEGFFNSETFIAGVRAAIAANTQVQLKALEGKKDELGEDYAKQKEAL
ncbi:MAG: S46 family peptidase, partial [Bacteroidetes bacterium]|nr:S46 family peptidase [Bacteroidota bacterium]